MSDQDGPYLVWSHEHSAWWRPNHSGYTTFLAGAGRYSREEALRICTQAHGGFGGGACPPPEIPVSIRDIEAVFGGPMPNGPVALKVGKPNK